MPFLSVPFDLFRFYLSDGWSIAFRTGSERKSRVHIFWQKRIRQGDDSTPWWFPSETSGGAVRGNRIVLPIPPGTHGSDAKPLVLPGVGMVDPNMPKLPKPKKVRVAKKIELVPVKTANIVADGLFRSGSGGDDDGEGRTRTDQGEEAEAGERSGDGGRGA